MAQVDVSLLSKAEHDSLACGYAALLLHDDGLDITVCSFSSIIPIREKKLQKFLRQVETMSNHTGQVCLPKLSKVKTLKILSQQSLLPP